jgi:NADPH:quinone reductase-like Zn-dependent oxidoreductase
VIGHAVRQRGPHPALDDDRALVRLHAAVPVLTPGAPNSVSAVAMDAAGIIRRAGRTVAQLVPGDRVFGRFVAPAGERPWLTAYSSIPQWWALAPMPPRLCFEDAAACISPGLAALAAIDAVQPRPGDRLVVISGTHPVSVLAIQLARARGALVTTSGSRDAAHLLRALGAVEVIDTDDGDLNAGIRRRHPRGVTAVIDPVGDEAAVTLRAQLLHAGGRLASVGASPRPAAFARRRASAVRVLPRPSTRRLLELATAIQDRRLMLGPLRQDVWPSSDPPPRRAATTPASRAAAVHSP